MLKSLLKVAIALGILQLLPNVYFTHWISFIITTLCIAILFYIVEPIVNLVTLPFRVVTFGLVTVLITVASIWLVTFIVPGFVIDPLILFGRRLGSWGTLLFTSIFLRMLIRLMQKLNL